MRIFLDTSVLSETNLSRLADSVLDRYVRGDQFFINSVVHFQIEWGYHSAGKSPQKYKDFLNGFRVEVLPVTKMDAEEAAKMKPGHSSLLDALIASSVKRYDGILWTADKDFLRFLPKSHVRILL